MQQRERELASELLLAEQGHWFTRAVRPLWALPLVIYTWKIVIFDKVLALGGTDPAHRFRGEPRGDGCGRLLSAAAP